MIDRCNAGRALRDEGLTVDRCAYGYQGEPHLGLHLPPLDTQERHTGLFKTFLELAAELARKGWRLGLAG